MKTCSLRLAQLLLAVCRNCNIDKTPLSIPALFMTEPPTYAKPAPRRNSLPHIAMSNAPSLITVYGATGNQGGAVARSLLKSSSFRVRALTRTPASAASQALAEHGAEIHAANGLDLESVAAAFEGSWGVYVNINSDDKV